MPRHQMAISVKNLGKRYAIAPQQGGGGQAPTTLGEALWSRLRGGLGRDGGRRKRKDFWALKEISFDIHKGDVVGIIGRNGAGKSTLLKTLSRITAPTTGEIKIYGRVGSLLEVGTGFHPELTGRENIYLNGSILGMRRAEIQKQFDAIVDFAEIEQFVDTPVKHYSSGMYVRLAFAVAAHLNPEILIVDEVLAVGDSTFQKKCLGKMDEIARHGRTVIFVSHNMSTVLRLCQTVLLLDRGRVTALGCAHDVIHSYLSTGGATTAERTWEEQACPGNEVACLRRIRAFAADGRSSHSFDIRSEIRVEMTYDVLTPGYVLVPNFHFFNEEGTCLFVSQDLDPAWRGRPRPAGEYTTTLMIPGNFFAEGTIVIRCALTTFGSPPTLHFDERDAISFQIVDSPITDGARGDFAGHLPGVVRPLLKTENKFNPVPVERNTMAGSRLAVVQNA